MSEKEKTKTQQKKGNSKKKQSKRNENVIPKTITDSIPYKSVYTNGIIEVRTGFFSKSYKLSDVNFKTATEDEQQRIAEQYSAMISEFDAGTEIQITLHNHKVDADDFESTVLLERRNDELDLYRNEYNHMVQDKMALGRNNLTTDKYLTVTIPAFDVFEATEKFTQIDERVRDNIALMTKADALPMSLEERLEVLNVIYNQGSAIPLNTTRTIKGKEVKYFSLENCAKQGITTKDVIAPSNLQFKQFRTEINENILAKTYIVENYPSWIKGTILTDFATVSTDALISVYYVPIEQTEAIKLVRRQGVNVASRIVDTQKKSVHKGIDPSLLSPSDQSAKEEIDEMLDDMTKENMKLFTVTFMITIFADDEEKLKSYASQLKMMANKNLINLKELSWQTENAFNSTLPIGNRCIDIDRLMTSLSIASIVPFNTKEISAKNGMYYGVNTISKNLILYNRSEDRINPNACILGMPGAGKSFAAKREMINVLLNTNDDVLVIDPEREFTPLANAFNGAILKIANGSDKYINPFDLNINNVGDDNGDPVKVKSAFIETIVEIMIGGKYGLSPTELSIINRSASEIYEDYVSYLRMSGKSCDPTKAPTMLDFYNSINNQEHPEAYNIALALERFVKGSFDIFSHHTNIDIENRFKVYDIKEIGSGLKELGLQITLDSVWNKMLENFEKGKKTWLYIDEFHLLMQKPSAAAYIAEIWKRARKWGGVPCAITQNVEDMLKSPESRTVINNCSVVMILGQTSINRMQLSEMLGISPEEQKYISAAKPGMGLLHINDDNIPFDDSFPKDTELYKFMTTKAEERL